MKYSTALMAAGAGVASAFPSAPNVARDSNPWQAPQTGDQRGPCPGLNTLANHGYINRNGQGITVDMAVKGFKDAFNMGSDIVSSAGGSALSVCSQVTGSQCSAFNLHHLNTPHTFEHDGSLSRQDYNNGLGNNHDFNQDVFNSVLKVWEDTNIISYSYANAARLMRINDCKAADQPGWFTESDGTALTEISFWMGTMGTPEEGNARKDWIQYWWTHERLPTELGWSAPKSEHNQSTINNQIQQIINAPPPPVVQKPASSSAAASTVASSSTKAVSSGAASSAPATTAAATSGAASSAAVSSKGAPVTLPLGYGVISTSSSIHIVPVSTSTPCTLPEGFTYSTVNPTSFVPVATSSPAASSAPFSSFANSSSTAPLGTGSSAPVSTSAAAVTTAASNMTATPITTVFQTTSTVFATTEITVTSCAPEITNCPAESKTQMVITSTISSFTTVCPVTATMIQSSGSLVPVPTAAPSSAPETFTVPPQTVSFSVSAGVPVPVATSPAASSAPGSSAPAAVSTSDVPHSTMNIPNPYFTSVPASVFPSVPASVISQYSASTGAYAAPSFVPQYTESGPAAIASATDVLNTAAPASAPPTAAPVAATTPAAIGYGAPVPSGVASSTGGFNKPTAPSQAPVQTIQTGGVAKAGVSGFAAVVAILALL